MLTVRQLGTISTNLQLTSAKDTPKVCLCTSLEVWILCVWGQFSSICRYLHHHFDHFVFLCCHLASVCAQMHLFKACLLLLLFVEMVLHIIQNQCDYVSAPSIPPVHFQLLFLLQFFNLSVREKQSHPGMRNNNQSFNIRTRKFPEMRC